MNNGRKLFDQPVKNDIRQYKNISKIFTAQGNDRTIGFLLDFHYFNLSL